MKSTSFFIALMLFIFFSAAANAEKNALFSHARSYFLPFSYVSETNQSLYNPIIRNANSPKEDYYQNLESEFQISFFLPVAPKLFKSDWDLNIAYTHHSWWQVYNSSWSKPFRETDYNPEIYFRQLQRDDFNILDFKLLGYDIGYMISPTGKCKLYRAVGIAFLQDFF